MKKILALALLILMNHQLSHAMAEPAKNYYEILGVATTASQDEIKKAFRQKALQYHPDKNKDDGAADMFKEINNAYETLQDEEKRTQYNREQKLGVPEPKKYPTDKNGIIELYRDLLARPEDGVMRKALNWSKITDFCTDPDLQNIRQDLEVAYICRMAEIVMKLINIEPLTLEEKVTLINNKEAEPFYIGSRKVVLEYVDQKLQMPLDARPFGVSAEGFYAPLLNRLTMFTPSTGAKIINLYVELIAEYIAQKHYDQAQNIAQKALNAAQSIEQELQALKIAAMPKFKIALTNLNTAIGTIKNAATEHDKKPAQPSSSSEQSSSSSSSTSQKVKSPQEQMIEDEALARQIQEEDKRQTIKTRYDIIQSRIGKDWPLVKVHLMRMAENTDDQYSYALTSDALRIVRKWMSESHGLLPEVKKTADKVEGMLKAAQKKIMKTHK